MTGYVLRRLAQAVPTILLTSVLIFLILHLVPGDPAAVLAGSDAPPDVVEALRREMGLDRSLPVQYLLWLSRVVRGDLGVSYVSKFPVWTLILRRLPATLELTLYSFIPIMVIGVWLGTVAAVHRDKLIDHGSRVFSISFRSLPSFVWGLLILMILYGRLNWFPPGRLSLDGDLFVRSGAFHFYTRLMTVDALLNGKFWIFWDALRHLMGPVLTLTMISIALLVRVTRSSMLEVLRQDYVRTARAKGLDEDVVINVHARKNALIPVITLSSLTFVGLLGGVVITETIFNFPGIGRWGAFAAQQLDIPGVTGFAMFVAALTVLGNLAADILYAYFDPRVRLQ